jgi:endonuclease/exonuclease/phosphatase family metal-dependent hydrolase
MATKKKTVKTSARKIKKTSPPGQRLALLSVLFAFAVIGSAYLILSYALTTPGTVRIVSWNVGLNNPRHVGNEVLDFMRSGDIMGMQELNNGSELDAVKQTVTCSSCAYGSTLSSHSYAGSSPNKHLIVWKKAMFTHVATGFVDVSPNQTVNDRIGDVIPVKFIVWTKLQDKTTGRQFYVLNTHLVNGVEKDGKPRTDVSSLRLANYRNHMDKLVSQINTFKAENIPIFITGDFNVNYRYDRTVRNTMFPYYRMNAVGVKSSYQALNLAGISSTTPSRLIDYVFHQSRSDVTQVSEKLSLSTHGSDHFAVYNTVVVKPAP